MLDEAIEYLKTLQLQVQVMLCSLRQKNVFLLSPPLPKTRKLLLFRTFK